MMKANSVLPDTLPATRAALTTFFLIGQMFRETKSTPETIAMCDI
jgi:hypothetical protein